MKTRVTILLNYVANTIHITYVNIGTDLHQGTLDYPYFARQNLEADFLTCNVEFPIVPM